jgi:hypothetical protein
MTTKTARSARPLWQCPGCQREFVTPNMSHSCGRFSVEQFLKGKSAHAIGVYRQFSALVNACGPIKIAPAKTRIGFQVRMIFAAVNGLSDRGLRAHVVLSRRLEHPRFSRIEKMTPKCYVHHFTIQSIDDCDEELRGWLCEAYKVGSQERLFRTMDQEATPQSRDRRFESNKNDRPGSAGVPASPRRIRLRAGQSRQAGTCRSQHRK